MAPLILVCALCLPDGAPGLLAPPVARAPTLLPSASVALSASAGSPPSASAWAQGAPSPVAHPEDDGDGDGAVKAPFLVGVLSAAAVGGQTAAALKGFGADRIVLDNGAVLLGSVLGVAGLAWASFALGPKGGGLLLPFTETKLVGTFLLGGLVGGVGGLAAAEAITGNLHRPWALAAGAAGYLVTSALVVLLVDGIFHLPVWTNLVLIPLGLTASMVGGYALASPRPN